MDLKCGKENKALHLGFKTFILIFCCAPSTAVMFQTQSQSLNDTTDLWLDCWQQQNEVHDLSSLTTSMGQCVKHGMFTRLTNSVEMQCVDFGDGVTFLAQEGDQLSSRDLFPLGEEPSNFRVLADAYSSFLSRRGLRWDLSHFYPGLVMRIGPTLTANGVLDFIMDRPLDYVDRTRLGPGHHFVRRSILPHILGFRMNLLSLLPLVFGILVFVAKNAFIFSKLTLIISTLLALKSLFVLQHLRPPNSGIHEFSDTVGGSESIGLIGGPRPQPHSLRPDLVLQMFASAMPPFRGVNDKPHDDRFRGERNFAWQ